MSVGEDPDQTSMQQSRFGIVWVVATILDHPASFLLSLSASVSSAAYLSRHDVL